MNRRGFLGSLAALAGLAAVDPEKLLWQPGKLISISPVVAPGNIGEDAVFQLIQQKMEAAYRAMQEMMDRDMYLNGQAYVLPEGYPEAFRTD